MIPCLYDAKETAFVTNGIGKLCDAFSCIVTEKRNGSYELKMEYPSDGIHAEELVEGSIVLAKPSEKSQPQPFQVYKIATPISGKLVVYGRHIQYRQNYMTVSPFSAAGCAAAMQGLKDHCTVECPFTFWTDIDSTATFLLTAPATVRSCLGGMEGSLLDVFGGEYEWDMFETCLHASRGADYGVRIVYGKNLVDFKMEWSMEAAQRNGTAFTDETYCWMMIYGNAAWPCAQLADKETVTNTYCIYLEEPDAIIYSKTLQEENRLLKEEVAALGETVGKLTEEKTTLSKQVDTLTEQLSNVQKKTDALQPGVGNILWGKKWFATGDSFTSGGSVEDDKYFLDGPYKGKIKTYPLFIGIRNNMEVINDAISGSIIALDKTYVADKEKCLFLHGRSETGAVTQRCSWHGRAKLCIFFCPGHAGFRGKAAALCF